MIEQDDLIRHVNHCLEISRPFEAYRAWRLWCSQNPSDPYGWVNASASAANAGFHEETIICALEFFKIAPNDHQLLLKTLSMALVSSSFASSLDQHNITIVSNSYTKQLRQDPQLSPIPKFTFTPVIGRTQKIRVGYFWNYFNTGAEFCFPFHHNRDRFEILAVMPAARPDRPERIGVDHCIEYPTDDLFGAVRTIRAGNLDILIDLNGRGDDPYSDLIIEARAAPLQAIYGNFHASTFSPSIDALIGDRAILEIISAHSPSERQVPLSNACMAVRNPLTRSHNNKYNIPARRYKYRIGTTGNHLKISSRFLKFIATTLNAIPDSSFLYPHSSGEETTEYIAYMLMNEGISPDRIEIYHRSGIDYFSMLNEIDVALDSLPYNGHLSTYEFLAQGTPVWSVRGPRMTQRYGHMLIGHVGMPEWVFDSEEDLIASLAKNIQVKTDEAAASLRQRVADSALGDPIRATRMMEDAIETLINQTGS